MNNKLSSIVQFLSGYICPYRFKEKKIMAGEKEAHQPMSTLNDYLVNTRPKYFNTIAKPKVQACNMEINSEFIHLVQKIQFWGYDHEDPYANLATFVDICCNMVKIY